MENINFLLVFLEGILSLFSPCILPIIPVVFDETTEVIEQYGISAFPTTYLIDKEGNIQGYITGAMDRATMKSIIGSVE